MCRVLQGRSEILHAATKIWHSQINTYLFLKSPNLQKRKKGTMPFSLYGVNNLPRTLPGPAPQAKASLPSPLLAPHGWNLLSHSWDGRLPTNEGQECGHWSFQECKRRKKASRLPLPTSSPNTTRVKEQMMSTWHSVAADRRSPTRLGCPPQWPF